MKHGHTGQDMSLRLRMLVVLFFACMTMLHDVEPRHAPVADITFNPHCAQVLLDQRQQTPLRVALVPSSLTEDTQTRANALRDKKTTGYSWLPSVYAIVNMADTPPPPVLLRGECLKSPPFRCLPSWHGMIAFSMPPPRLLG